MSLTTLFDIIYKSHCTISTNFYFKQKNFSFNEISGFMGVHQTAKTTPKSLVK